MSEMRLPRVLSRVTVALALAACSSGTIDGGDSEEPAVNLEPSSRARCSTTDMTPDEIAEMEAVLAAAPPAGAQKPSGPVSVYFHIIRRSDGTGNEATSQRIANQMQVLNA